MRGLQLVFLLVTAVSTGTLLSASACADASAFDEPLPVVVRVSPERGPTGGGYALRITGSGFRPGARVLVGGLACSNARVQPTEIICTAPARPGRCGALQVEVGNLDEPLVRSPQAHVSYTASLSFQPGRSLPSGPSGNPLQSSAHAPLVRDLDLDGRPDVLVISDDGIHTHFGDGAGRFSSGPILAVGTAAKDIGVTDVDHDGFLDLLIAETALDRVQSYLGRPGRSFQLGVAIPFLRPTSLALGDIDQDRSDDILIAGGMPGSEFWELYLGSSQGQFSLRSRQVVAQPIRNVLLGDVTGDGVLDIVATYADKEALSLRQGFGNGFFAAPVVASFARESGAYPGGALLADLTRDGVADLLVSTPSWLAGSLRLLPGNQAGMVFSREIYFPASINSFTAADVDSDGVLDIVTTSVASSDFSVHRGTGDASWPYSQRWLTTAGPLGIAVADLDGDGLPDLLHSSQASAALSVFLQQCN